MKIFGKKIVCLGGGNGMPKVLEGLKKYPVKITAICAMLDSGGSSGRLRKEYKILAPGDIRRAFIALANTSPAVKELLNFRFKAGALAGHNLANLLIAALELSTKDYKKAVKIISQVLNVKHKVLPITIERGELYAVLENGKIIKGEGSIDKPKHNGNLKIKKIFLKPKVKIYPEAKSEIEKADLIVIGPGDLYSTLGQIFLTSGVKEALQKRRGKLVYILNLMTKFGETNKFSAKDFVAEVEKYLKTPLDFILYNTKMPSRERIKRFRKKHPELLAMVEIPEEVKNDPRFIGRDLLEKKGDIEHSPEKTAKALIEILKMEKLCK